VNTLDAYIGDVVKSLKDSGLWDNTLLVIHTDNGGEIMVCVI
jgi:arylsulfatase A-like enzyme